MSRQDASFEILETLAEGAFGVVCVARVRSGELVRTVALKILKIEWMEHAEVLGRTRDEARLLAMLNHPYIVRVDRLARLWGRPTIVMEYVPGASLLEIVKKSGPVPLSVVMSMAQRVSAALHAAFHRPPPGQERPLHVVHRDIKPSNIVIGIDGEVKVLDFGTARGEFKSRESETRVLGFGSMGYVAPERLEGEVRDSAIDIYALGVVMYEVLSGRRLSRLSFRPIKHEQQVFEHVGPMQIPWGGADADRAVRDLLTRMMSYKPANRPSAAEVVHVCEDILRTIPSAYHISTEAFAREVVEPIYQSRELLPPPQQLSPSDLQADEWADLTGILPLGKSSAAGMEESETRTTVQRRSGQGGGTSSGKGPIAGLRALWHTEPVWLARTTLFLVVFAVLTVIWSLVSRS